MSNIILLNGPCGIGKSTIAGMLHEELELSFLREKDVQRRMFSDYKSTKKYYEKSGSHIGILTKGLIQVSAKNDVDLIVEGVFTDQKLIEEMKMSVDESGSQFIHVVLTAEYGSWKERLLRRGMGGSLTLEKAEEIYQKIAKLDHSNIFLLGTHDKTPEEVVGEILNYI